MSEDATQQLLISRVEQLISIVTPISGQIESFEKQINERLDNFEKEVNERFDKIEKQQAEFSARLERLETIVDQRLYDTRPLWESVLSQIAELDKKIDTRVEELRAETSSGFRAVDRKIGALSKNLIDMTAEIQELREMVEKIEAQPA